jgi:hypothetical protein
MAKLAPAWDWQSRDINDWNTTTFRSYLQHTHEQRFGIAYVSRSIKVEAGMLSQAIKQYGKEALKEFIDECFLEYKPSPQYPSLTFGFMYSYMRERIMPKVLAEMARKERLAVAAQESVMSEEELTNWL